MFTVRFMDSTLNGKLFGQFATTEKARWWAEQECDGRAFTIHRTTQST